MNLEESDLYKEKIEKNTERRRIVMFSIILCAFLVVFLVVLIMILKHQDSITEKLFVDRTQVSIPEGFYIKEDDVIYINIRSIGSLLDYTYTRGDYNEYNENERACYLQNDFEIVSISESSDKFKKYIQVDGSPTLAEINVSMKNENGYNETFKLVHPIIYNENGLYASIDDVSEMFNLQIDWETYRFRFYTLEYVINRAKTKIGELGIKEMSGYYENLKSILYGFVIVGDGESTSSKNSGNSYGVVSLETGKEIISIQYDDIKFAQNSKEFYVTTSNGTMGVLDQAGERVIEASTYENISLLDDEQQLYLVEKDDAYGVTNKNGALIIHPEIEEIGMDVEDFGLEKIENSSLLFGKVIPVKNGGKYGLYNTSGDLVLGIVYESFGYKAPSTKNQTVDAEQSVLIIPSSQGINGIVINLNGLYGIFDVNKEEIILPCVYSKIYAVTKSGETTYYMEYDGETRNLKEYLEEKGFVDLDDDGNYIEQTENENTEADNTTTNSTEESNETTNTVENVTRDSNENVTDE